MPLTTASVYIWYPHNGNIGHASMHIGAHKERDDTDWYVSWWPGPSDSLGFLFDTDDAGQYTHEMDVNAEECVQHAQYKLYDLDITKMKAKWDEIRTKPSAHYQLVAKNCATIVARVLRAGGAADQIGTLAALSYAHNLYWSPKDVAQFCDRLVKADHGVKYKNHDCPLKGENKLFAAMGLR